MHKESNESAWRVLFDIALSHGESLQEDRMTYAGFLAFVGSAELVGPNTGVYPVLLEQLWHEHSRPASSEKLHTGLFSDSLTTSFVSIIPSSSSSPKHAKFAPPKSRGAATDFRSTWMSNRSAVYARGVVGFEGFTDIMNVVSVRCYQTSKCAQLLHEDPDHRLSVAIALSAEDKVRLEESVHFTAYHYLKSFVMANTIHTKSRVRLDPRMNDWTPRTNMIVSHVVGSLQESVIMPIFRYFSPTGRMTLNEYMQFVSFIFPHFGGVQRVSAQSIFSFPELFDLSELLCTRCHIDPLPAPTSLRTERTLGLDGFVDAVLMLAVVAFSNERAFPHHRSITAKMWSLFEVFLCPAVSTSGMVRRCFTECGEMLHTGGGVPMAVDPLFSPRCESVRPAITHVFPTRVPVDHIASVLVSGFNLLVEDPDVIGTEALKEPNRQAVREDAIAELVGKEDVLGLGSHIARPKRLLDFVEPEVISKKKRRKRGQPLVDEAENSTTGSSLFNSFSDSSPSVSAAEAAVAAAAEAVAHDTRDSTNNGSPNAGAVAATMTRFPPSAVATNAARLFNSAFEHNRRCVYESTTYGERLSSVYVNEDRVVCFWRVPNYVEVALPPAVKSLHLYRLLVSFKEETEEETRMIEGLGSSGSNSNTPPNAAERRLAGRLSFTPVYPVLITLRGKEELQAFAKATVHSRSTILLVATSVVQRISSQLLVFLADAFHDIAEKVEDVFRDNSEGGAEDEEAYTITVTQLVTLCKEMGLVNAARATEACTAAVRAYTDMCRLAGEPTPRTYSRRPSASAALLTFSQFVCCVAHVCMQQSSTSAGNDDVPDVPHFLSVALGSRRALSIDHNSPAAAAAAGAGAAIRKKKMKKKTDAAVVSINSPSDDEEAQWMGKSGGVVGLSTIPHNARIEVPYQNALERVAQVVRESSGSEGVASKLREAMAAYEVSRMSASGESKRASARKTLPPFPRSASTTLMVSQYSGDEQKALETGLRKVAEQLEREFLKQEVVIPDQPLRL